MLVTAYIVEGIDLETCEVDKTNEINASQLIRKLAQGVVLPWMPLIPKKNLPVNDRQW